MALRILHLTKYLPPYQGGIESVTTAMADAGVKLGLDVKVVGFSNRENAQDQIRRETSLTQRAIRYYFRLGPVPVAPGYLFLERDLASADIVQLQLPNPLAELAIFRAIQKKTRMGKLIPVINAPILRAGRLGRLWEEKSYDRILSHSEKFIVSCEQMFNVLPVLKKHRSKAVFIPFAVQPSGFDSDTAVSEPQLRIVAIGRLVPYKGFDILLKALAEVSSPWSLTLIGSGPQQGKLEALAQSLGVSDRVHMLGHVLDEAKYTLLRNHDLFVLPSTTIAESFGIAIAEAMSVGKAVITTKLGTGVDFLSRNGECGAVVEPGNVAALARAIDDLARDPKRRAVCGKKNHEFWLRELSPEVFQSRYRSLIAALSSQQAQRSAS